MKRKLKNIIMILIIIAVGVCSYYTMKNTQITNNIGGANQQNSQAIPQMPLQNSNNSDNLNSNGDMGEPQTKPDEENNSNSSNNQNSGNQMGVPPTKPDGENSSSSTNIIVFYTLVLQSTY